MESQPVVLHGQSITIIYYMWRAASQFIALLELMGESLMVLYILYFFYYLLPNWDPLFLLPVAMTLIVVPLSIWSSYKLLVATKLLTETKLAQHNARIWLKVTFVFFIITCIGSFHASRIPILSLGAVILVYGSRIHVVARYTVELNEVIKTKEANTVSV